MRIIALSLIMIAKDRWGLIALVALFGGAMLYVGRCDPEGETRRQGSDLTALHETLESARLSVPKAGFRGIATPLMRIKTKENPDGFTLSGEFLERLGPLKTGQLAREAPGVPVTLYLLPRDLHLRSPSVRALSAGSRDYVSLTEGVELLNGDMREVHEQFVWIGGACLAVALLIFLASTSFASLLDPGPRLSRRAAWARDSRQMALSVWIFSLVFFLIGLGLLPWRAYKIQRSSGRLVERSGELDTVADRFIPFHGRSGVFTDYGVVFALKGDRAGTNYRIDGKLLEDDGSPSRILTDWRPGQAVTFSVPEPGADDDEAEPVYALATPARTYLTLESGKAFMARRIRWLLWEAFGFTAVGALLFLLGRAIDAQRG